MGVVRNERERLTRRRALRLRRGDTDAEARIWAALRDRRLGGWKWRRQVPVGPYVADFLCAAGKLVVELDGSQHDVQASYDARRTAYLATRGLTVLRFDNRDALTNEHGVCAAILDALGGDLPGWDPIAEASAKFPASEG
jgi:very-short-patch-repair endonuclease